METATIILGLAACGGLVLAGIRLSGRPRPPTWLALGHGAIAATGLVLLIVAAATSGIPALAQAGLGVIVLAALGGTAMFVLFHLQGKALPIAFVLAHGVLAITGFTLLAVSVFG